jgi:hypothetical protein
MLAKKPELSVCKLPLYLAFKLRRGVSVPGVGRYYDAHGKKVAPMEGGISSLR